MRENNLTKEEKYMYTVSLSFALIGALLLVLLNFSAGTITGAAVLDNINLADLERTEIDYDNFSYENITQETALNALLQAADDIEEVQQAGFGVVWFNDTFLDAERLFEGTDYTILLSQVNSIRDARERERARQLLFEAQERTGTEADYAGVIEKTRSIGERKAKAYEINDLIRASELRIGNFKNDEVDTLEAENILADAKEHFRLERFEEAEAAISSVESKLIELGSETTIARTLYKAGRDNVFTFFRENYVILLAAFIVLLLFFILSYNRIRISFLRKKINDMKIEEEVLSELMKKAQSDYYAKKEITKSSFKIKMEKYKESLAKIKELLPVKQTLLEKRLRARRII